MAEIRKIETSAAAMIVMLLIAAHPLRSQDASSGQNSQPEALSAFSDPSSLFYPAGSELIIRPYDVLRVEVFDVPELSRECTVSRSGSIALPLLPVRVRAAGLSPAELSAVIGGALRAAGLVSNPHVSVEMKKSRLHSVVIGGAVKKPQIYPLFDRISLLDLLAKAGGLSRDAGNSAIITRGENSADCGTEAAPHPLTHRFAVPSLPQAGEEQGLRARRRGEKVGHGYTRCVEVTVNLRQLLQSNNPRLNVDLYPGDTVTVQRAGIIYVVGAVNRPGGFPLTGDRERVTVLQAIALAEGLKSTAIRNHSLIIRQSSDNTHQRREVALNLGRIFAGKASDPALHASDILFVPDSTSRKALRRAAEAAVEITTGVIIFRR
jgi:polysaccharide export outer membrane protein